MQRESKETEFYPDLPTPRLPLTLPLSKYTGTYFHPAYQNITIFLKDGALLAHRTKQTVSITEKLISTPELYKYSLNLYGHAIANSDILSHSGKEC